MRAQKMIAVAAAVVLALSAGAQAGWITVADWQFNGDSTQWLQDSSGNGYNLTNVGATQGGGGTTASFGGYVTTNGNTVDLSGYRQVRVSWRMLVAGSQYSVIWELGVSSGTPGAIEAFAGNSNPANHWTAALNGTNCDQLSHSLNTWQTFVAEYDLDATTAADVVRVWIDGTEQADSTAYGIHNLPGAGYSFLNADFFIGARSGGSFSFGGEVDYLTIEVIPEPASAALLLFGGAVAMLRRRKR